MNGRGGALIVPVHRALANPEVHPVAARAREETLEQRPRGAAFANRCYRAHACNVKVAPGIAHTRFRRAVIKHGFARVPSALYNATFPSLNMVRSRFPAKSKHIPVVKTPAPAAGNVCTSKLSGLTSACRPGLCRRHRRRVRDQIRLPIAGSNRCICLRSGRNRTRSPV
jgi:hypothetical protein